MLIAQHRILGVTNPKIGDIARFDVRPLAQITMERLYITKFNWTLKVMWGRQWSASVAHCERQRHLATTLEVDTQATNHHDRQVTG